MKNKRLFCFFIVLLIAGASLFAGSNSKILIGQKYSAGNSQWIVPVLVSEDLRTYSISIYNGSFKLTSVSGSGYSFKDGCTSSMSTTGTASTSYSYTKITLSATSKSAAETAFKTLRYTIGSSNTRLQIEGIDYTTGDKDVFLNGHIYRISTSTYAYFKDAMNWAFNQGGYPVTITSDDENLVAFIFFKKLNNGKITGSGNYNLFYLGAVPSSYSTGSITVAKNSSGVNQVSVSSTIENAGSAKNSYKWIAGTPEAGLTIPTTYWCDNQPDSGGPIVYGHAYNGISGAGKSWDDHNNTKWTVADTEFKVYACAEIEPDTLIVTTNLNHNHTWVYTAKDNVLTATCSTGDCASINTVRTITLKADIPTYTGTAFAKNSLFTDTEFEEFNVSLYKNLSVSDIKVYKNSDSSKTGLTSLIDEDYTAALTCGGATATLPVSIKHDHVWEYSKLGTKIFAKCVFSTTCPYNSEPAEVNLLPAHLASITADYNPADASDQSYEWVYDEDQVVVDFNEDSGIMKSKNPGSLELELKALDGSGATSNGVIKVANPVTGVTLNKTSLTMSLGDEQTLTGTIKPDFVFSKKLIWSSSNETVATVDEGKVSAVGLGTATVTVLTADGCKTATCAVTVSPVAVTGVKLDKSSMTVSSGTTASLTAAVLPDNASNKSVTWSSSNGTVCTVDGRGKLTPKSAGTAVITVKTADGSKTATCTVKVI